MGTTEPVNTKDYMKIRNLTDSLDGMAEGTKNSLFFQELWTNPTLHLEFIMREKIFARENVYFFFFFNLENFPNPI